MENYTREDYAKMTYDELYDLYVKYADNNNYTLCKELSEFMNIKDRERKISACNKTAQKYLTASRLQLQALEKLKELIPEIRGKSFTKRVTNKVGTFEEDDIEVHLAIDNDGFRKSIRTVTWGHNMYGLHDVYIYDPFFLDENRVNGEKLEEALEAKIEEMHEQIDMYANFESIADEYLADIKDMKAKYHKLYERDMEWHVKLGRDFEGILEQKFNLDIKRSDM